MRFGFVESRRPELGDAEANECERAQFVTDRELRRVQSVVRLQMLRLLGDSLEIAALTGEVKPAPTGASPLESVIDCSPRALAGPGAGLLVSSRNAYHL